MVEASPNGVVHEVSKQTPVTFFSQADPRYNFFLECGISDGYIQRSYFRDSDPDMTRNLLESACWVASSDIALSPFIPNANIRLATVILAAAAAAEIWAVDPADGQTKPILSPKGQLKGYGYPAYGLLLRRIMKEAEMPVEVDVTSQLTFDTMLKGLQDGAKIIFSVGDKNTNHMCVMDDVFANGENGHVFSYVDPQFDNVVEARHFVTTDQIVKRNSRGGNDQLLSPFLIFRHPHTTVSTSLEQKVPLFIYP